MLNLISYLFPNVINKIPELINCSWQTLFMMLISGIFVFAIGGVLGITIVVTAKGGILENTVLWTIIDKVINFFRSVPFIILIALLIPVTRALVGTAIGVAGAIPPLIFGAVPFFTRQMQAALSELDKGTIEAAQSMGISPFGIIWSVYFRESLPSIIRGCAITMISLVGLTAMAGAIGGGGLGDFAIRYGYQRYQTDVTIVTVILLVALVTFLQTLSDFIIKKIKR